MNPVTKTAYFTFIFALLFSFGVAQSINISENKDENILKHYVYALSHDSMQGRATGTTGMLKAAEFIAKEMKIAGLNPVTGNEGFFQWMKIKKLNNILAVNVIGAIEGKSKKDEVVIICAHYDHLGLTSIYNNDSVYNGANDNASGTATILFLAGKIKAIVPERTILFIAFSGEELGLLGSSYFASIIDVSKIKAVINFEMMGIPQGKKAYVTGADFGLFFKVVNNQLFTADKDKYGEQYFLKAPEDYRFLFKRSDNYPFALKKIPSHTIYITDDRDKHYHQLSDEAATLDYSFMLEVVEASFIAIKPLINGKVVLKRISVK